MKDKQFYYTNTKQVNWSDSILMYGGKNWVPGYSYKISKCSPSYNDKNILKRDMIRLKGENWNTLEPYNIMPTFYDENVWEDIVDYDISTTLTRVHNTVDIVDSINDNDENKNNDDEVDGIYDNFDLNEIESMITHAQVAISY